MRLNASLLLRLAAGVTLATALVAVDVRASARPRAKCQHERVTISGSPRDDVIAGTRGNDVIAGFGGNDRIRGRGGFDVVCGGSGDDVLDGGDAIDFLAPGGGRDLVSGGPDRINVVTYAASPRGVVVDLAAGVATGWGRDNISRVHQVYGSRFDDLIAGDRSGNALIGWRGNDTLRGRRGDDSVEGNGGHDRGRGGRGIDVIAFLNSPRGIRVNLAAGRATGEGRDRVLGFEDVVASTFSDVVIGNARDNFLVDGGSGDDEIEGRNGDDVISRYRGEGVIRGGNGRDTVHYVFGGAIDLSTGSAVGLEYSDTLSGIENVLGSPEPDVITGSDETNLLEGRGRRDEIHAGGGDDTVRGNAGDDTLAGGLGTDRLSGGRGDDTCIEGEVVVRCERALWKAAARLQHRRQDLRAARGHQARSPSRLTIRDPRCAMLPAQKVAVPAHSLLACGG